MGFDLVVAHTLALFLMFIRGGLMMSRSHRPLPNLIQLLCATITRRHLILYILCLINLNLIKCLFQRLLYLILYVGLQC